MIRALTKTSPIHWVSSRLESRRKYAKTTDAAGKASSAKIASEAGIHSGPVVDTNCVLGNVDWFFSSSPDDDLSKILTFANTSSSALQVERIWAGSN